VASFLREHEFTKGEAAIAYYIFQTDDPSLPSAVTRYASNAEKRTEGAIESADAHHSTIGIPAAECSRTEIP
jgi:hypothetical protein